MESGQTLTSVGSDVHPCPGSVGRTETRTNGHSRPDAVNRTPPSVRLKNWESGSLLYDILHRQAPPECPCSETRCLGSLVFPRPNAPRPSVGDQERLRQQAAEFLHSYYSTTTRAGTAAHEERRAQVEAEIGRTGRYRLTATELSFGAKQAWRNAARCVGRAHWSRLQIFDARDCASVEEMFEHICNHIKYSTNKGNIRSAITIFPPRCEGKGDFRVWNSQYIHYAGFAQPDGSVLGDGATVEITQLCEGLGWQPNRGRFTVLPLVLQVPGGEPTLFSLPPELVLEVELEHPQYEWFGELGLRWYGLPAVANMLLEVGGLEFPAAPFNGWYTAAEIGARNLGDTGRYDLLKRGGCPTDWVWVQPPISGSLTPLYHQEMLNYSLTPAFRYLMDPWKTPEWRAREEMLGKRRTIGFRQLARAVEFSSALMVQALARRVRVTILYATETGRAQTLAQKLCTLFSTTFNPKVQRMDEYDIANLEHETLLLVVASTFGNGDPPENGEAFAELLIAMTHPDSPTSQSRSYKARFNSLSEDDFEAFQDSVSESAGQLRTGPLASVRFGVFGLGSRAYPHFCAFARAVDTRLQELGGERLVPLGEGDELCGQDDLFRDWARTSFQAACESFCIEGAVDTGTRTDTDSSPDTPGGWSPDTCRISVVAEGPELVRALSQLHRRKTVQTRLLSRRNLQAPESGRRTVLVGLALPEGLSYQPGDHVGIHPDNPEDQVQRLLRRLESLPPRNDLVQLERLRDGPHPGRGRSWVPEPRLPPCTVSQALTHLLDITSPPSPDLLLLLASLNSDPQQQQRLITLGQGVVEYEQWRWAGPSLTEVLEEFSATRVPAALLLLHLPLLQPRYYSASSCPFTHPAELHLTVAVVEYRAQGGSGPLRHGVCSSWLDRISPGDLVCCYIRRAPLFRLPDDPRVPCVLVGPGTGVAPFRGFWQQRLFEIQHRGQAPCPMTLVFGCRRSDQDHIYREEMLEARDMGVFTEICTAYSRDQNTKVYVQDVLRERLAEQLYRSLHTLRGHLYVCGDVTMAQDVSRVVQEILAAQGGLSLGQAAAYITGLKEENRYHEDIFGVTLRTREVTTRVRSTSFTRWQEAKAGAGYV
ncbi:nitric oxide synthase, endothelial-like [Amblyraja radiata]|uniref:nitric oxide synthase, endothelial-like n=1 Tax=Amblyraja radiata TaxID=386614 RepID=UPI00140302DC|nr:nitric oxide synthase, endothelial-like [Amblyraja radiata]